MRGQQEREERKTRVANFERRHKERISKVPDWLKRSWDKMERWLERSRWEEEQKELRLILNWLKHTVHVVRSYKRFLEIVGGVK